MDRQTYEVVPEGKGWAIRHDGRGLLGRRYWKSDAVELGTSHAITAGVSRLLIFRKDGSLEADFLEAAGLTGIEPTVIEINIETVRELREHGADAVYGDATRPETLIEAGIETADNLILTSAGMANSEEVIRAARDANPRVRVLARASYLRDLPSLRRAGADTVFTGEGEVALAFVEEMLERLGATAEQIDRERDRAHNELFGDGATSAPPHHG